MSTIKPTLSVPIFDGEVTVHGFGREHGVNFSFRGIDDRPSMSHETHRPIFDALASIPTRADFYAPSPVQMNAEIVSAHRVNATLWKHYLPERSPFILHRGGYADGVSDLGPSSSYVVSAVDCALIVVKNGNEIVAAHAGRNSIVDIDLMKGKKLTGRKHESVVHATMSALWSEGGMPHHTEVWVGFSISPGPHFAHSFFDENNRHNTRMVRHISNTYGKECFKDDGQGRELGWLDTKELIRRQFIKAGVPENNIELDSVCTYSDKDERGEYLWYSNKRPPIAGKERNRNLFAVVVN